MKRFILYLSFCIIPLEAYMQTLTPEYRSPYSNSFVSTSTYNMSYGANYFYGPGFDMCIGIELTNPMTLIIAAFLSPTDIYFFSGGLNFQGLQSVNLITDSQDFYADEYPGNETGCQAYIEIDVPAGHYYIIFEPTSYSKNISLRIEGIVSGGGNETPPNPPTPEPIPNPASYPDAITIGSSNHNHIVTRTYTSADGNAWQDVVGYYDGLGRPEQTILVKAGGTDTSTGRKDLVSLTQYDAIGRVAKNWLPAAMANSNNGAYVDTATVISQSKHLNSNNDNDPYSLNVYEPSPLNRIVQQFGPGAAWRTGNVKPVATGYLTNTQTSPLNCTRYSVNSSGSLENKGYYATAQLYVVKTTDEDGNVSYTFTDKLGRTVLTRQMNGGTPHDTYYVYDDYGNLRFVLPPMYQDNQNATGLARYAYQYKYDNRNRCIEKKLPGCEYIRYVYDTADRLILTQDANQRAISLYEWTFTIPDALGRTVLSGSCRTYSSLSSVVKASYNTSATGNKMGYAISGISMTDVRIGQVYYYDNYDFKVLPGFKNTANTGFKSELAYDSSQGTNYNTRYGADNSTYQHKGKLTGTAVAKLDIAPDSSYLYTVIYYDNRSRLIQTKSTNQFTNGYEKEYIAYNFVGQPVKRKHIHYKGSGTTTTEEYAYTYDQAGRLLTSKHKLNSGTEQTLIDNVYDDLGRLKENKRNNVAALKSNYTYNVRSWLKTITGSLFNETLYYNDAYAGSVARYNGNIGAMTWKSGTETTLRGYTFAYDNLSRLITANYKEGSTDYNTRYGTSYTYDKHGNMLTLNRKGNIGQSSYGVVDNLTMNYTGNQLTTVSETASVPGIGQNQSNDFRTNSLTGTRYAYDANGNRTKDLNQKISNITYNILNLPRTLTIDSQTNQYVYAANGRKLTTIRGSGSTQVTTQYAGNMVYENNTLKRILVDGGYIENGTYYYYLQDHLGNNRVVASASGTVQQTNHYYPYGMLFGTSVTTTGQPYKYGAKEFDGNKNLFWSDFEARQYYATVSGFTTMDPMAERYPSMSPYVYCAGNPIRYVDPTGMDYWSTSDPDEIRRFMESYLAGNSNYESFNYSSWGHATDAEFLSGLTYNDKTNMYYSSYGTVENGEAVRVGFSMPGYSSSNIFLKANSVMGLVGTIASFSDASLRFTNGVKNGSQFSPKWYASGWTGGSKAQITTYQMSKIGKVIGGVAFGASILYDGIGIWNYYNNPNSSNVTHPMKAGFNAMLGSAAYSNPYFAVLYGVTEVFVPGGINTVIQSSMEVHRYHNSMSEKYWWYPNYSVITQF
ncbi:MAG: DUF6443 domain-containing protein [Prevotellaceae bacterium]|nr:DUF6443 domain-containing protein [Prevotellaceae bacterium]